MSEKNEDVFTERDVVSIVEISNATGLSIGTVRDVLLGGVCTDEEKATVEDYVGMEPSDMAVYFGRE